MINYNKINNDSLVVVNVIRPTNIYCFCESVEGKEELQKAIEKNQEEIETWLKHCNNYPCEKFENYLKQAKEVDYKIMAFEDFIKLEKSYYLDQPLQEITEDKYYDMLNVLPPLKWTTIKGVEEFLISEMLSGTYTNQYANHNGKYYTKVVDAKNQDTWIHNLI